MTRIDHTSTARALRLLLVLALFLGLLARPAAADEAGGSAEEDRLARLEALIEAQAAELARLRGEMQRMQGAQPAPTAAGHSPAPLPLPAPSMMPSGHATAPAPVVVPQRVAPAQASSAAPMTTLPYAGNEGMNRNLLARAGRPANSGLNWGGYLTVEYVNDSQKEPILDLHRFILQANANLTSCIDMSAEIEIEHGGIGGSLDGDVKIEFVDVVARLDDRFNPKVGALLIPFGRYNRYHDDFYNDFTLRPWTARYFVPTGFGQPGIGAEGTFRLGNNARLSYDIAVTQGFDDEFSASSGVRSSRRSWRQDNNDSKQVWSRVSLAMNNAPFDYLEAGLSGTYSRYDDDDDNDLRGFAIDLLVREGPWEFKGEYIRYDLERDSLDPADAVEGLDGLWLEANYHFFPSFLCDCVDCNCLVQDTSLFTLSARYQHMDLDDRRRGAAFNDDLSAFALGLNYRITESMVLRADYEWRWPESGSDQSVWTISFSTGF